MTDKLFVRMSKHKAMKQELLLDVSYKFTEDSSVGKLQSKKTIFARHLKKFIQIYLNHFV